jgi:nucleoid DNA-binding protein
MTVNTTELIEHIAEETGLPRSTVHSVVTAAVQTIQTNLTEGEPVRIHGLGTFSRGWRNRSTVRSMATRQKLMVGGRHTVRFKPAKRLKDALMSLSDQSWRDKTHQDAWRQAEVLIGDLDLYATDRPRIKADMSNEDVTQACERALGQAWSQATITYRERVAAEVDADMAYLLDAARRIWKQ